MPAIIVALIIALTAATGGGTVYAAQGTLPGDTLYPVKTAVEQVQVVLAMSDQAKAETYLMLTEKRLTEVQEAIQSGRPSAASVASEALAADLARADQHLMSAAASGQDVSVLASNFSSAVNQVQLALTTAKAQAPEPAQPALTKATEAAATGLAIAGGYTPSPSTSYANTPRPTPTSRDSTDPTTTPTVDEGAPTETTGPNQTATAVAGTITQLLTATKSLTTDPLVPGQSYDGLLAKLDAAQNALAQGQTDAATQILDAYLGELNALQRSGHISDANYQVLYADYSSLDTSLGGTPKEAVASVRVSPRAGEPDATPGVTRPTPEGTPGDDGTPRSEPTETPARPTAAATPTERPTDVPTPRSKPTDVPTPHSEPTDAPTPSSAPTQVPPTPVPSTPPQPTPRNAPTSVPPSPAPTQPPAPTSVPRTPPPHQR